MKNLIAIVLTALTLSACTTNNIIIDPNTNRPRLIIAQSNNHVLYLRALPTTEADLISSKDSPHARRTEEDYDKRIISINHN